MKLGITTNVFAGPLKGGEIDLEGIIGLAGEWKLRSVEIRDDSASLEESRVRSLVRQARDGGLFLSYGIKNDMMAQGDLELVERAIRLASNCGRGTVVRMLASQDALKPAGKKGYSVDDSKRFQSSIIDYGRIASTHGVVLAIENARDPLYGGDGYFGLGDLIKDADKFSVGLTFDPANATNPALCKTPSSESEVLRFIGDFGGRFKLTHYKTTRGGAVQNAIGEPVDVDNFSLLSKLFGVFEGVLCIEIPGSAGLDETKLSIEQSIDYLRGRGLTKYLE